MIMPATRPKKESGSATPPSDEGHFKGLHAVNKSKRKYVYVFPIFLRLAA
jgi:hypothetical protein